MKLSEYLKQNGMSTKDYFEMRKRKEEGKTSLSDYQRQLYQEIKSTDLSDIVKSLSSNEFLDQETLTYYNDRVSQVADKVSRFKMGDEESNKSFLENLKSLQSGISKASEYYSTFKDEDAYKSFLKNQKDQEAFKAADLGTLESEIGDLESNYKFYIGIKTKRDNLYSSIVSGYMRAGYGREKAEKTALSDGRIAKYDKELSQYGDMSNSAKSLSEKKQFYNNAKRIQEGIALQENAKNAEDFDKFSKSGADIENPTYDEVTGHLIIPSGVKKIKNKVTYSRDNFEEYQDTASKKRMYIQNENGSKVINGINELYTQMTDEEVDIYNYYLSKEGEEKANQFLDSITESLNYRQAEIEFEDNFRNNAILEGILGLSAGLDQWASGVESLFNTDGEYVPQSVTQIMGGMAREDLGDDYGIVGQGAYDLINTTGNMLPSILVSTMTGNIAGGLGAGVKAAQTIGKIAGAATLGSSAAGNGYQEMLNLGYDKSQAQAYGTLVGVSEAGLEYLLGGISSLGGKFSGGITDTIVTKLVSNVDDAIAKVAIGAGGKLVGSMVSEFGEEYLQEVLDPVFKNITLHTDEDIKFFSSEALYSGILGALSAGLLEGSSTISGEVATYKQGKAVKDSGQLSNLKKLGTSFSADTIAYKIASQVDENTDAYTIGQLLHEAGADGLSETNIAEITKSLERKNIAPEHAQTIAKWLNKAVEGGYFTKSQIKALENPDISKTFKDIIVNQNSTVNQRMQSYTDILQNIATEKANQKAEKANAKADKKANSEPQATEKTKTTPFVPYSNEEIAKRQAKGEDVNLLEGKSTPETEKALESKFEVNLEGKTVNVKSGEDVKVSEIASIDNGKMTLKLDNGETVDAEDISFGTEDEAIIYSSVLDMGVNAAIANSLVKNYNPSDKLSAKNYVLGIKEAYKYGAYGMPINEISKNGFAADLSEPQRVHAYNLGKTDMAAKVEKAQKEVEKVTSGKGGFEGKVHFNGDTLALKEVQRESLKRMGVLSEVIGVDIHVFESYVENGKRVYKDTDGKVKSAPNGYYKGGKIYIDLNAGKDGQGVMIYTVAHELTHFIREWSPAKFKVLADFLMEQYGEKGHNVNDLVQAQIDKAKRNNRTIDFDTAYEEVVADSMEMMLSDDAVYEKILELKSKDASIVKKIGEFFAKIVDSFKKLMQQYPPETPEGKLVSQMNDSFTKLQELFAEALVDASNNYQANKEQKNTTSEGDVKESQRLGGYFPEVNVSTKDISIFGIKDINNIKEVKQKVYNYLLGKYVSNDKISKPIKNIDTDMDIYVYRGGIDETFGNANAYKNLYTKKKKIKLATMTSLAKLIKYGEVRSPETPNIHNSKSENVYAYLTAPITIDGVEYMVNMDIKKTPSGNRFYVHTIKIADESPKSNNSSTKLTNSSAKDSIPQTSKKSQEKLSGRDSLGNTLTKAQQSYFAESKVRDENGNLKVMYRGDSNKFTVFDRKKTNYANLYGRGFYFTERKEHAEQYGESREFYLNIKTPLSLKQNNITKSQMLKFLEAIENDGDDYDLYNYGMDATAQSVLNSVWGKGDYEMLQDISASAIGDLVAAIELFNEVNGTTYDGIVLPTETITFESEQAKLTSNKNPTDDKDIRYSDRDKRYQELQTEYNQLEKEAETLKQSEEYLNFLDSISLLQGEELDKAVKDYGEWTRKSGLYDMSKRMSEIIGEQKDIRAALDNEKELSRDAYMKSIENLTEKEKMDFVNRAVERYGTTKNIKLASYLMLNGEMLDFSEGQRERVQDHREISEILDMPDSAEYSDGLITFMNMGNIRLQTYGIDISKAPNREQREALREVITQIMRNENEFSIDFSKTNGYTDGSVTYPRGTSTSKILSDIDSYFKTGVVPEYKSTFGEFLYSDRDSEGNTLTKEQQEYFKDSKVRDEDGNLLVVYHGSPSKFTVFSHEKMNTHGNAHGRGFYFTENKNLAEGYEKDGGQLLKGYLNIENPMSEEKVTIKKSNLIKFIRATCEAEGQSLVDNDGYDNLAQALKDTWISGYVYTYGMSIENAYKEVANIIYSGNDNDVDIIAEITNAGAGAENVLGKVKDILGFDGVIYTNEQGSHEFVSLVSNQFKNASNTNPTSDPDIRYSERVTDEETLDFLNEQIEKGEYIKVYRSFQVIDGGLYAPMNAVDRDENGKNKRLGYRSEYGVWEKSTESPEIAQRYMDNHPEAPYAKFDLDGVDNKTNAVAYNPYLHASNLVLNDQFAAAYRRNLITVECYVPLSEANGTYKAQYAKDATGWVDWKAGGVAGKLLKVKPEYTRKLFVSRYMLPVRQVPDSEVAAMYKEYLDGTDIAVPWNVVTPSLRKELEKAGVSISYDDVKAGSKTVSFNDVFSDEVKLSDRDSKTADDIKKINKQLARENVKLIEDVKYLKELVKLQGKETHGKVLKKSTVELVAKRLMAYANAKGDVSELVGHLSDVYSYIIQGEDVSWETIKEKSQDAVDWLMSNEYYKPVRNEEANEILSHLRHSRISLSESQKKEVAYRYGSYNEYRKKNMGRVIFTNDGVNLDSVWQELAELFPGHFDTEISEGDQPLVLMEKIDGLQNAYEVDDHHYYSDEMIAQDLLTKIYDGYWDVSALHTVADAKQKEINLLKAKHKERMDELRQSHEESDAKLRQEHREKVSQLRTQYREREEAKVKKVAEYYQKSRKDAVERVKETREKREAVTRLQRIVLDTAKWVSYPKKDDVKCPDIIRGPYAEFLSSIDLSSKRLLSGGEPTQNDLRVSSAMDSLAKAIEKKLGTQSPDTETETVLDTGYLDLPVHFVENLKEMAENLKKRMAIDGHVVNSMTSEEVKALTKFIRTLNHSIKEMSTLYSNMRFARVEQLGNDSMLFLKDLGEAKQTNSIANFVTWDNALPYYTFKRFGVAGESVFEELMDAQDKLAYLADEIFKFKDKTWTDKEASEWSKDTHTIELPSGRKLTLTSADAMSIYCLSRREQGLQHLLGGGVRVVGIEKNGKKANDSRSLLNQQDLLAIASSLTKKQMQVAEAIQEYMSTVCADWGNEISMKRFLTKEFTEKFYFPIESNDENLDTKDPKAQQSDLYRLLNISATKPLTKGANNEVIIRNVFDVFTNHSSDMAKLNAYGMALLDYMKWINYREKTVNDDGQISVSGVRKSMERAYGPEAKKYVIGLIKDINGRANDGGDHPWLMKMTRMAKTAMVGANLRVSLLQFTAYPRAAMVLSNRSLTLGLTKVPQIEKAKKYCGIALWKSFGFYDTNISRSIEDQIKGTTNIRQKLIELSLKGAEWGDAITWGCLWNACEYEVAKTKQYKIGSEEFNQAVGKKLRDVVYATQVVDSTLTRSQMMRNKSGLTQSASAFMSEPTLSANILMDAGFQFNLEKRRTGSAKLAWQKTGKYIGKTVAVYSIGQIIVALAEALADAYRDDDDEEFIAKYGEAFTKNVISDLNPFNKIPIIADVSDLIMSWFGIGFSSSNSLYLQAIDEASNAFEIWSKVINGEDGKTVYAGIYSTTKLISYITGISASGAMREVVTLWNNTAGAADPYLKIRTYESSATDKGIAEYKFDKGDAASVKTTVSKMVEDKIKSGKTEKEAKSAVRSSFTSSYKSEYIAAVKSRDYDEMNRIRKFLYSTGLYGSLSELDETLKKWRTAE